MHESGLSIQEMAKQSGLSEHTLRYYERIGLIMPIPRDPSSGHRRYSQETIGLIESLSCLRGTGVSLCEMRRYLALCEQGAAAAAEQKALFAAHAAEVACEMETLKLRLAYLTSKVAYWDAMEAGDKVRVNEIAAANYEIARDLAGKTKKRENL